jgi:hypothetical protein
LRESLETPVTSKLRPKRLLVGRFRRGRANMLFPHWLEATLEAAGPWFPVLLLLGLALFLWRRSMRPVR